MTFDLRPIAAIPTHVITGFLGAGKTTFIQALLAARPAGEVWAVLVNEFGEIGIDGALLAAQDVRVREVAGGCLCCSANVPLQVGLNALLRGKRPDRLLIEPSGLGHSDAIVELLADPQYRGVLDMRATLTLVDPRRVREPRYAEHPLFQRQIAVADWVLASKADCASAADIDAFHQFAQAHAAPGAEIQVLDYQALPTAWMRQPMRAVAANPMSPLMALRFREPVAEAPAIALEEDYLHRANEGDGFFSAGWVFNPRWVFDYDTLFRWLSGLPGLRMKAVMITERGIFGFNAVDGVLSVLELDECADSRIEIIDDTPLSCTAMEAALLSTLPRAQGVPRRSA